VGPLLGALTLTLISAFLARWAWIEHFANGALRLFALYVMPQGLAGVFSGLSRRLFGRRPSGDLVAPAADPASAALPVRAARA
ncbi:hypothetical protein ABTH30_23195, partial [Acinetobacter baumannii]